MQKNLVAGIALHIQRGLQVDDPLVRVPVLSEQITFMLPKFSIEARRLTITLAFAIRLAPWARLMLMIAGNNCGVSPTASATKKARIQGPAGGGTR